MKILTSQDKFLITQTLTDGEDDLFIRAKIFDKDLNDVTPGGGTVALTHIYNGFYAYKHSTGMPVNKYIVIFEVFEDASYVYSSEKYGIIEENIWVSDFLSDILTEIPDNILLDDDVRLDNLNLIPSRAKETTMVSAKNEIITTVSSTVDDSDGGAV